MGIMFTIIFLGIISMGFAYIILGHNKDKDLWVMVGTYVTCVMLAVMMINEIISFNRAFKEQRTIRDLEYRIIKLESELRGN